MGIEVVIGFLLAWATAKVRRIGAKVDNLVDGSLDAALDRLDAVVSAKLTGEPALEKLQSEADGSSQRTRKRVELAIEEAVENDPAFAEDLQAAVAEVNRLRSNSGLAGITIGGDVRAETSGIAIGGISGGFVSFGEIPRDPPAPGQK